MLILEKEGVQIFHDIIMGILLCNREYRKMEKLDKLLLRDDGSEFVKFIRITEVLL